MRSRRSSQDATPGRSADFGAFSFYVTKNVVTGEGGMVTTRFRRLHAARIKRLALHGLSADAWKRFSDEGFKHYEVVEPGFKYNMIDLQAALGLHQLARVEENLRRRQDDLGPIRRGVRGSPGFSDPAGGPRARGTPATCTRSLLDLDRLSASRDDVLLALHHEKIGTGVHYRALHLHPYYRDAFGYARGDFPNAEWISDRTLSLPLSPKLTDEDVESVIAAVKRTLENLAV